MNGPSRAQVADRPDRAPEEAHPDVGRIRAALGPLYADLEADIARSAPLCVVSGRCCRFAEYDHTLFLSAPELEFLLALAPPPIRPLDGGLTCPWQDSRGHCTAREARPLGCRIYFCDSAFQTRMAELAEEYVGRLKRLCDREGWAWSYRPLHHQLEAAAAEGRLAIPPAPEG